MIPNLILIALPNYIWYQYMWTLYIISKIIWSCFLYPLYIISRCFKTIDRTFWLNVAACYKVLTKQFLQRELIERFFHSMRLRHFTKQWDEEETFKRNFKREKHLHTVVGESDFQLHRVTLSTSNWPPRDMSCAKIL